jgi:hypothetical protein
MFPVYLQKSLEESLNGKEPDWWQLFIIDMAKYERNFIEVFNGPGHEGLIPNKYLLRQAVKLSPSVKTLQLNFPIAECIHNFRKDHTDSFPNKEQVNYVFSRKRYRVVVDRVTNQELDILQSLIQNPSVKFPSEYRSKWKSIGICY